MCKTSTPWVFFWDFQRGRETNFIFDLGCPCLLLSVILCFFLVIQWRCSHVSLSWSQAPSFFCSPQPKPIFFGRFNFMCSGGAFLALQETKKNQICGSTYSHCSTFTRSLSSLFLGTLLSVLTSSNNVACGYIPHILHDSVLNYWVQCFSCYT